MVGERLAKGWRRVDEGLAEGWRRVSRFPCTLQFRDSRGARLETRVCDSMGRTTRGCSIYTDAFRATLCHLGFRVRKAQMTPVAGPDSQGFLCKSIGLGANGLVG